MSFPKASIGNPVLINSMSYGCPTETFGHDKLIKRGLGNSPLNLDIKLRMPKVKTHAIMFITTSMLESKKDSKV